jgi:hypothetical protein
MSAKKSDCPPSRSRQGTHYLRLISAVPALILLITACSSSVSAVAAFQLPFLPVEVSIGSSGQLSLSAAQSVVTPFGTFSISANIAKTLQSNPNIYWLIIRHEDNGRLVDTVYEIYTDQNIEVDLDGRTTLQFTNQSCFIDASHGSVNVEILSTSTSQNGTVAPESVAPTEPIYVVESQPNDNTLIVSWQNTASNADYIQVCLEDLSNPCKNLPPTATRYKYYDPNGIGLWPFSVSACNRAGCTSNESTQEPPGISAWS